MPVGWSITQIWVKPSGIPQIWVNPQIWAITQNWGNHAQITQNWVLHLFLRVVIYLFTLLICSFTRLLGSITCSADHPPRLLSLCRSLTHSSFCRSAFSPIYPLTLLIIPVTHSHPGTLMILTDVCDGIPHSVLKAWLYGAQKHETQDGQGWRHPVQLGLPLSPHGWTSHLKLNAWMWHHPEYHGNTLRFQ